jgi:DNA-binding response OmpR family regulator
MTKTVLIAEDEPFIVQSLSFLLETIGLAPDIAENGARAMELLQESIPDILLLDLMMEHYDGFEILKFVRSEARLNDVKILVLSAKGQENDRRRAMELGADRFITKPYANKDVIASVQELLNLDKDG